MAVNTETASTAPSEATKTDWVGATLAFFQTRVGMMTLLATAGIVLCFWPLLVYLPHIWMGEDGYYTHGFLVPFIAGYVIYRWWPRLEKIPVKAGWLAVIPLAVLAFFLRTAFTSHFQAVLSVELIATIICCVWLVAGIRWAVATSLPVIYLAFALPLFGSFIEVYTNPLQILSTKVAYQILGLANFQPFMAEPTVIQLNTFTLNVEVPCSGLKLFLAVSAFTAFFMMIGNLKWWGNLLMVSIIIPLCLFINGLRIALIGMVGETYGGVAGHRFHDYSGYITLIICFFLLFKFARLIGWKD